MNKTKERPTSQPITVNIDKLSAMLSCGHATARKIGEQAGAKIVIGRRVLYSVEKVKNYLSYLCLLYTSKRGITKIKRKRISTCDTGRYDARYGRI